MKDPVIRILSYVLIRTLTERTQYKSPPASLPPCLGLQPRTKTVTGGVGDRTPDPHVSFNAVTGGKIWQFPFQRLNAQNLRSNCCLIKFKHLDINFKTLYMEYSDLV